MFVFTERPQAASHLSYNYSSAPILAMCAPLAAPGSPRAIHSSPCIFTCASPAWRPHKHLRPRSCRAPSLHTSNRPMQDSPTKPLLASYQARPRHVARITRLMDRLSVHSAKSTRLTLTLSDR